MVGTCYVQPLNSHIKLECLRLPVMKTNGNAKCKNYRFEPPFGEIRGNVHYTVHLWLYGKRVVDFLLVLIEFFSLALMAAALLSEICRNQRFLKKWVTLSANFFVDGDFAHNPSMDR